MKLSEASHETLVLEVFSVKFGGGLARNDHFGSFFCEILEEASHETLVLEPICEIAMKPRTKRSFWNLLL